MTNKDLLAEINKAIGDPKALVYGTSPTLIPEYMSTGIRNLDRILGGGLRKGSIGSVTGAYSSGKSLLAQQFIRSAQAQGITCAYLDTEHVFNQEWMKTSGIDIESLIVSQVVRGEKLFDIIHALVKSGEVGLIIVDSVSTIISTTKAEGDMEQKTMGEKARIINQGIEMLLDTLYEEQAKTIVVFISQQRTNIGGSNPMEPTQMAGGMGLGHYSHLIMDVRRIGWTTEKGAKKSDKYPVKVGYTMQVKTNKSKQSAPFQTVRIPVSFANQMDAVAAVVYEAIDLGIIVPKGSYFDVGEEPNVVRVQGKSALLEYARDHPAWVDSISEQVEARGDGEVAPDSGD